MARLTDAILDGRAYARGSHNPMLDMSYGGQQGYSPDMREWVSNANYMRKNLIPLLLEAPQFFKYLPEPEKWVSTLKSLVELHPRRITGFNRGLTVDTVSTPVGGGGEEQEEFSNVTRARSTPSFEWDEKYGMPIANFFYNYITYGMMDPDTKVANIGTLPGARPGDMLPDMYAATMIFIEPDPTHRKVVQAFLCTNMFPKGTGEIIGERDITSAKDITQRSVEWTAITQTGIGVNALAQMLLDRINITNANPYLRPAFINDVSRDVEDVGKGYRAQTEDLGATAITRP